MVETVLFALLQAIQQHPNEAAQIYGRLTSPGVVNAENFQTGIADASAEILKCYHKTARFQTVDIIQAPFERQSQYGADQSLLLRINYMGISGARYFMDVALLTRGDKGKAAVINDTAAIPYSKRCALNDWS